MTAGWSQAIYARPRLRVFSQAIFTPTLVPEGAGSNIKKSPSSETRLSLGGEEIRYLIMIGAMPAVAVRHERRKNTRDHPDAEPGLLHGPSKNIRPRGSNPLKLRPTSPSSAAAATLVLASGAGNAKASVSPSSSSGDPHLLRVPPTSEPATASIGNVTDGSLANSRTGSPVAADPAVVLMYGDECCYAKVSLLHFIVFFILGGITVIIIGAVQFHEEAGLSRYRYQFLLAGVLLITFGFVLLFVKCHWFRQPLPFLDEEESPEHKKPKLKSDASP